MANDLTRGIILYAKFERFSQSGFRQLGGVDPVELRRAALYWDRIDHPTSAAYHFGTTADEDLLAQEHVLTRTKIRSSGPVGTDFVFQIPGLALMEYQRTQPGRWALGQSSPDLVIAGDIAQPAQVREIELYAALPVPGADVHVYDILQFKHQREAELGAFRSAMDGLYDSVLKSPDTARAHQAALLQLETRLSDVTRVVSEKKWPTLTSSLTALLSIGEFVVAASQALVHPIAGAVGMGGAVIKIGQSTRDAFKNPMPGLRDYAYLGFASKELGARSGDVATASHRPGISMKGGDTREFGRQVKLGRNDPCFCGSNKKYKKCHGA